MTKKTFYEKVGRRYVPVKEYDSKLMDSFSAGAHLVMSYPGGKSIRYNINPEYAPLVAALRSAEDMITRKIHTASVMRTRNPVLTPGQVEAWNKMSKEFGDDLFTVELPAAADIARDLCQHLIAEADEALKNPAVRSAYEHFLTVYRLSK